MIPEAIALALFVRTLRHEVAATTFLPAVQKMIRGLQSQFNVSPFSVLAHCAIHFLFFRFRALRLTASRLSCYTKRLPKYLRCLVSLRCRDKMKVGVFASQ